MPWKSKKQEAWGNSESGKEAMGEEAVEEFNAASKGKKLPKRAKQPYHEKHDMADHVSRLTQRG